jgi:hypothetical protein
MNTLVFCLNILHRYIDCSHPHEEYPNDQSRWNRLSWEQWR